MTERAAVLGRPITHSLSPVLHRAAYAALGLTDWTYEALDIGAEDLPVLLAGLDDEWRGFSVTMPCKQSAVTAATEHDALPLLLGAANTLVRVPGGWRAENTDVSGIGMALQLAGVDRVEHAAILGAGGTAGAAAVALASLGAQTVEVVVRDPARAAGVVAVLDALDVTARVATFAQTPEVAAPVVVSTVPADGQTTVAGLHWAPGQTVLDVLYAGWPTPLASAVAEAGGVTVHGLDVLFWQATVQVELITGRPAPIEAMRAALDAAVLR